jgi:hypothetical protein
LSSDQLANTFLTDPVIPGRINRETKVILYLVIILLFLELITARSTVGASYCQIASVSFNYPSQVVTDQKFSVSSTVKGSCAAGDDYPYSVRVDVIDKNSGHLISSSGSHIVGYNASNFSVTLSNSVTAPGVPTQAWNIEIVLAVLVTTTIGPQDATGYIIRDYSTIGYATIQVGSTQAVSEFPAVNPVISLSFALALAVALMLARSRKGRSV